MEEDKNIGLDYNMWDVTPIPLDELDDIDNNSNLS